jgi:hypothetical protein
LDLIEKNPGSRKPSVLTNLIWTVLMEPAVGFTSSQAISG